MATERELLSPTQVGLGVLWPACWAGLPIKLALALVLFAMGLMQFEGRLGIAFLMLLASPATILAMPIIMLGLGSHFGEGIGLPILFLSSIPIDIWAFGVVGKTYLLERLRKEPPNGLGFTLWWKSAVAGAVFLPIMWFIVSAVTETAVSTSHSIAQAESLRSLFDTGLPIAERIGLEVTLWGTLSLIVLIVLMTIGVSTIGRIVCDIAAAAPAAPGDYQALIVRWDLMRVPRDQGLFLTVITGIGVLMCLLFWAVLPETTPHPHECCKKPEVKAEATFKPIETLNRSEQQIGALAAKVEALEQQVDQKDEKEKGKGEGKANGGTTANAPAVTKP
jgi:hypothetical protein